MSTVVLTCAVSHTPFLYTPPERWEEIRRRRADAGAIAEGVPRDSEEENLRKHERCQAAFEALRERIRAARPDVLVIFGDDQGEQFDFANFPAFSVFLGESFEGYRTLAYDGPPYPGETRVRKPRSPEHWGSVAGHPRLARALLGGLLERGFDPAFSLWLSDPEEGMGHAFLRPLHRLTPDLDVPAVPVSINCYYAPQPSGRRCAELGRAVREAIEQDGDDLRVAVLGSGGLWHTPTSKDALLDEAFDAAVLDAVRAGDVEAMARVFDARADGATKETGAADPSGTGVPGGLGSGSGEVRNWIAAAAAAGDMHGEVIDYVPVYASPCGVAFAVWDPQEGSIDRAG